VPGPAAAARAPLSVEEAARAALASGR